MIYPSIFFHLTNIVGSAWTREDFLWHFFDATNILNFFSINSNWIYSWVLIYNFSSSLWDLWILYIIRIKSTAVFYIFVILELRISIPAWKNKDWNHVEVKLDFHLKPPALKYLQMIFLFWREIVCSEQNHLRSIPYLHILLVKKKSDMRSKLSGSIQRNAIDFCPCCMSNKSKISFNRHVLVKITIRTTLSSIRKDIAQYQHHAVNLSIFIYQEASIKLWDEWSLRILRLVHL